MAKPTPGPDLSALTDLLRELFATMATPPPKPSKKIVGKAKLAVPDAEEEDEEEEEDLPAMPMGMPMGGKPMRRVTISILMPAKGLKPKK